jgi:hypothetical protein
MTAFSSLKRGGEAVDVQWEMESDSFQEIEQEFAEPGQDGRRVERAVFETDRHRVVGDVTLPPAGYQSRFSDSLNRTESEFVPLTNVEITSHGDGSVITREFLALNKRHVRISYPLEG